MSRAGDPGAGVAARPWRSHSPGCRHLALGVFAQQENEHNLAL